MTLPIVSNVKEIIVGEAMESIDLAKRSAALLACKKLHSIGELDHHFLPKKLESVLEDKDYLLPFKKQFKKDGAFYEGTTNKKRPYKLIVRIRLIKLLFYYFLYLFRVFNL